MSNYIPTITVRPQRKSMLSGINDKINILFEIKTPELPRELTPSELPAGKPSIQNNPDVLERPPIDLAIVLDRSGSMDGDKSQFAKKAIIEIINALGPKDRIHFVVYWDIVQIVFQDANPLDKDKLIPKINEITNGGSTNLSGGIKQGFELLKDVENKPSNILKRIFLFTDGIANAGTTSEQLFQLVDGFYKQYGVTTTCFGLGEDFDEVILREIAERGSGDYFFIQSPENVPLYVSTAIDGLTHLVGTEGKFTLTGTDGTISSIYGTTGDPQVYHFGDIVANEQINIVAVVEVDGSPKNSETPFSHIATWEFSYKTRTCGENPEWKKVTGEIEMNFTTDLRAAEEEDQEVLLAVKIKEFGAKEKEGKFLYEQGKLEQVMDSRRSYITELREFQNKDPSGRIVRLIQSAEKQLSNLQKELDQKKLLTTLNPAQSKFLGRFGYVPTDRKSLLPPKKRVMYNSSDYSSNSPAASLRPPVALSPTSSSSPNPLESDPTPTTSLSSPDLPTITVDNINIINNNNPNPNPNNNNNINNRSNRNSVSKYFSSAEYLCNKDSTFSWKNAHVF